MSKEGIVLSDRTLKVLKNFNVINTCIIIDPGSLISTSREGSIFAWTTVDEEFPYRVPIFELAQLVSVIQKCGDPRLEFQEQMVLIKSGKSRAKYKYTAFSIIEKKVQKLPFKSDKLPPGCKFVAKVTNEEVDRLKNLAATLSLGVIEVVVKKGVAVLRASKGKANENTFEIGLAKDVDLPNFRACIDLVKFVLIDDAYEIYVIPEKAIVFKGEKYKVNYLIMVDIEASNFEGGELE